MTDETFDLQPPEPEYVSEDYVLKIPVTERRLNNPWELRKYAAKLVEKQVGDTVQITSLKVKKPSFFSRALAQLLGRTPQAKLHVTVKF